MGNWLYISLVIIVNGSLLWLVYSAKSDKNPELDTIPMFTLSTNIYMIKKIRMIFLNYHIIQLKSKYHLTRK